MVLIRTIAVLALLLLPLEALSSSSTTEIPPAHTTDDLVDLKIDNARLAERLDAFEKKNANSDFDKLLAQRDKGMWDVISLISFLLTFMGGTGIYIYRQVEKALLESTRTKILANESSNMIRLGLRDHENFTVNRGLDHVAHGALLSAISHTRQAWHQASRIRQASDNKTYLLALSGSNLGYYYTDLVLLLKEQLGDAKQRERLEVMIDDYRQKALSAINAAALHIEACKRKRVCDDDGSNWFEIAESTAYTRYFCNEGELSGNDWARTQRRIKRDIKELANAREISEARITELCKDWAELLGADMGQN